MEHGILYEDADVVIIDKPSGIMTHPDIHSHLDGTTVSEWFAARYPHSREVGEPQKAPDGTDMLRPGIIHRLDKETSGVLILAKTPEAHAFLKERFQKHEVEKTYLAFVYGVPTERHGIIDFPIGRSRKDFRLRSAQPKARGTMREARTRYEVLGDSGTHALLKAMPETGRTHQIRAHLKAIHHPVVCDALYAPNHPCDLGFNRLGLHAYQLTLTLPSGERITCTAPLPHDLEAAAKKFTQDFAFG